jgi:hypothetical protein
VISMGQLLYHQGLAETVTGNAADLVFDPTLAC